MVGQKILVEKRIIYRINIIALYITFYYKYCKF